MTESAVSGLKADTIKSIMDAALPLRFLDADILKHVVAPGLHLNLSLRDAHACLEIMAAQSWLFETVSKEPLCLAFRRDVRRSVLRQRLNVAASRSDSLVQLLDRASTFFENKQEATEAAYIAALKGETGPFENDRMIASAVYGIALPDLKMFSPAVRGTLTILADPNAVLSDNELKAMPCTLAEEAGRIAAKRRGTRARKYGFSGR